MSYSARMIKSGSMVELYVYEKPIMTGYSTSTGRKAGQISETRREDNINATRAELRRIVESNLVFTGKYRTSSKFLTLTFADNVTGLKEANKLYKAFIQRLNYHLGFNASYTCVPEFQKRGAVHYHVIFYNLPFVPVRKLTEIWGHGFIKINKIDNLNCFAGEYVSKYLRKEMLDKRLAGQKVHFSSRGINRPVEITDPEEIAQILANGDLEPVGEPFEYPIKHKNDDKIYGKYRKGDVMNQVTRRVYRIKN